MTVPVLIYLHILVYVYKYTYGKSIFQKYTYRIAEKSYMYLFYIWDFEAFMHTNDCEIQ